MTVCNLYSMTATVDEMKKLFGAFEGNRANLPPFDEIYPGKPAPVLRHGAGGGLELETMTWGFPGPVGAKGRPVTNVRNLASPFWRSALNSPERRCVVPVTRFCEWTGEVGAKRKVWFGMHQDHDPLFAFAGLWRPGEGGPFMAFLTCEANALVGAVHPKAMPVMLRPRQIGDWLEGTYDNVCALAIPFADGEMRIIDDGGM
ncbi:SOS response-associated peptidase [Sphingomonas mesophila]|uniref:SOS response-associated peptidase n=1 Tax=Sphingomonas mesophila TaxID=2303576 RepID=UPI000E57345B|nr:SOS response-associated peptidase family protein [Sphingomonas mesophila]